MRRRSPYPLIWLLSCDNFRFWAGWNGSRLGNLSSIPSAAELHQVCYQVKAAARLPLDFRDYAASSSQARRMTLISSRVGWSGLGGRNLAAMRTRRSLAAMSAVDGWALVVYQGGSA